MKHRHHINDSDISVLKLVKLLEKRDYKIEGKIFDSDRRVVGTYETGETESQYISEEEAQRITENVRHFGKIARLTLPRMYFAGLISSRIAGNTEWLLYLLAIPITLFRTVHRYDSVKYKERDIVWEVLYMIFLLIIFLVYYVGS